MVRPHGILLLICVLLLAAGCSKPAETEAKGPALAAKAGTAPVVDGRLGDGEWADASMTELTVEPGWTVKAYYKYGKESLYFAFTNVVFKNAERYPEVLLEVPGSEKGYFWFHASYRDCDAQGAVNAWHTCKPVRDGWTANNFPLGDGPVIEMQISYAKLGLKAGSNQTLGIAFNLTDTKERHSAWPDQADITKPATWGRLRPDGKW